MATESEFTKTISGYYRDNEFALRHTAENGMAGTGACGTIRGSRGMVTRPIAYTDTP
ncbi:MAG: hypothetical protein JWQ55_6788 [Rhodopila sp.]|nr:hypothetical protein [Rhodopila sp.]